MSKNKTTDGKSNTDLSGQMSLFDFGIGVDNESASMDQCSFEDRDYEKLIDQIVIMTCSGKEYTVVADYGNVLKIKDGMNSFNVARSDIKKRA